MARIKPSTFEKSPSVVYMATNEVNGKRYIGVTCRYLSQRKAKHFSLAEKEGSNAYFHRAIRKHGRDKFTFDVLCECETFGQANLKEIELIASLNPEYNILAGGGGSRGYKPTDEVRKKASERMKGTRSYWVGRDLPASFFAARNRYATSDEGRASWARCRSLGPQASAKKVVCLDDGMIHDSATSAGRFYNIGASSIGVVCGRSERRRTAGGRVFRFFGDHEGGVNEALAEKKKADKRGRKLDFPHYRKRVQCLADGKIFEDGKSAAIFYGVHYGTLNAVCRGQKHCHTAGGLRFKYLE